MKRIRYASLVLLIAVLSGCTGDPNDRLKDYPRLVDVHPKHQEAATRVAAVLKEEEETPSEFFAQIEEKEELLIFHLWHESAFRPENRNAIGNPGGKNRTIEYNQKTGEASTSFFWQ